MDVFPLHYPGTWLDGLTDDKRPTVEAMLRVCETHVNDAAVGLALFAAAIPPPAPEGWPRGYAFRLPFIHAHTVLYALDGVEKALHVLARVQGLPGAVAGASGSFKSQLPTVRAVRDSSHHLEDRARGLDRDGKPLSLKPVTTMGISAPNGGMLGTDNLHGNCLAFTGSDGEYHQVEISAASVAVAQTATQQVIDALPWRGPDRTVPL